MVKHTTICDGCAKETDKPVEHNWANIAVFSRKTGETFQYDMCPDCLCYYDPLTRAHNRMPTGMHARCGYVDKPVDKPVGNDDAVAYFRETVKQLGKVSDACDVFKIGIGLGSYIVNNVDPVLPTLPIRKILTVKVHRERDAIQGTHTDIVNQRYKGKRVY